MDLLTYYLLAGGIGLIQCLAAVAKSRLVNKAATILNWGGVIIIIIIGLKNFDIITMLGGVLTVFLVGMILSYIILKIKKRNAPVWQPEEEKSASRVGANKANKRKQRKNK